MTVLDDDDTRAFTKKMAAQTCRSYINNYTRQCTSYNDDVDSL